MHRPKGPNWPFSGLDDVAQLRQRGLVHEHPPWLRAFVAGDDAAAFEHVDQTARSGVADAQAPLDQRDGCGLRLHDDLDRLVEQRILVGAEVAVRTAGLVLEYLRRLAQRLVELLRPLGPALLDDQRDLVLGHERALNALQARGAEWLEEHVALAEEAFGPRPGKEQPGSPL